MLEDYINTIIQGDCLEILENLPENCVDVIFADPPYYLQLKKDLYRPNQTKVDGVTDQWDKFESFSSYDEFTFKWLEACRRVLKEDGSLWVIGTYHNIHRIGTVIQDLGFWILNDILWIKTNPTPNFRGTRFNNAHEILIWAAKNKTSRYTFHHKGMKVFNEDKQMRSDWYIPVCNGRERIKVDGKKAHSTQKPEELLYRVIMSSSNVDDIVLDPFMGSGTTAAAAKKTRRNFIGIEKEQLYVEIANKRINAVEPLPEETLVYHVEKTKPKVPFGNLVAKGYIKPGEFLFDKEKNYSAEVQADSSLRYNDFVGSIHKVGAFIQGQQACNGWKFWYIERDGQLLIIDKLRAQYRQQFFEEETQEIENA